MRVKLADANEPRDLDFADALRRHRREVEARLRSRRRRTSSAIEDVNEYTVDRDARPMTASSSASPTMSSRCRTPRCSRSATRSRSSRTSATRATVSGEYHLDDYFGSHGIGHVRMATESDVDISNAHPYWAYPVLRRRRGAQRSAHQLPPVAPAPRARRPPLRLRLRLGDHRRLPRRADGPGRVAQGGDANTRSTSSTACSPTSASPRTPSAWPRTRSPRSRSSSTRARTWSSLASEEMAIRAVIDHEIETYDPYESEVMVWTR